METVIRVAAVYLFIMVGLRVLGKREFAQLSALELVALMMIPELVSNALQREAASLTNGFIGVATLFVLVFFTSMLMYHSEKAAAVISGTPVVLVHHGQLIPNHLDKERVDGSEIFNSMHTAGLSDLSQIKWAILESDGKISIIPEDWAQPAVTIKQAKTQSAPLRGG